MPFLASVYDLLWIMSPFCASFIHRNDINRVTFLSEKNVAYPNTVTCLLISVVPVNKQIKSNHQLTTLSNHAYFRRNMNFNTCTQSRCSWHGLRSNNHQKNIPTCPFFRLQETLCGEYGGEWAYECNLPPIRNDRQRFIGVCKHSRLFMGCCKH